MIELDVEEPKITTDEELLEYIRRKIPSRGTTISQLIRLTMLETKKYLEGERVGRWEIL